MAKDTGAPYALRYPEDGDVADVPNDIKLLAEGTATALNGKLTKTQTDPLYQKKITVQSTAPTASVPASPSEGDIVFVVP